VSGRGALSVAPRDETPRSLQILPSGVLEHSQSEAGGTVLGCVKDVDQGKMKMKRKRGRR
jgi:hypothetical protein